MSKKIYICKLILILFLVSYQFNYSQSIIFKHITAEDGLSNNKVNTVIQDKTGFIWLGTEDGLNRYDGYNFKIFRHDPADTNSISDNTIWALTEDNTGNIWIGTKAGVLNKYDPVTEKFTSWKFKSYHTNENSITALYEDRKGNIWIGTRRDGIYKFKPASDSFNHWSRETGNPKSLSYNSVRCIIEDNNGNILVGTYHGLNKFNPRLPGNGFQRYYYETDNFNSISGNIVYNLSKSAVDPNIIWIGTPNGLTEYNSENNDLKRIEVPNPDNLEFGSGASSVIDERRGKAKILWTDTYSGLIRMNMNTGNIIRFVHKRNDPSSLISNQINKIIRDRAGVIWIATENGVSYCTGKSTRFNSIADTKYHLNSNKSGRERNLRAVAQNSNGTIWLGFSDGLVSMRDSDDSFSIKNYPEFSGINVWCLANDNNNSLWVGTFGQGLIKYVQDTHKMQNWISDHRELKSSAEFFVKSLLVDNKNNLWVGFWGYGVARISLSSGNYKHWVMYLDDTNKVNINDEWVIKEDRFERIWLGTQGEGLNLFEDKNGGIFHHWLHRENDINSLSSNNIYSICESKNFSASGDSVTILWIGTSNGLNRFAVKNKKGSSSIYDVDIANQFYAAKDGLPDNSVNSILEDDNGNLWLGTGRGISYFNIDKKKFTNFSSEDGLNGTVMNPESAVKLNNGLFLFGSTKGINVFNPEDIKLSNYKPEVVITDFQIFNKSVKAGKKSLLKRSIFSTNKIELSNDQNVFSFEFAALDFNSPGSIQYKYMMEGFDDDWIYSGNRRFATYTNLSPGEYTFKVKATNADKVWNSSVASVKIIMKPPWWRTLWAYGLYLFLIIIGLLVIRRFELNRAQLRNELKMREFEIKKKSELEELKSRFFANLSHEFRTPLMLIKGPLEQIKEGKGNSYYDKNIEIIERNSNHLKELIDQLLELSQLEKAEIPLRAKQEDIVVMLKGLIASFESAANQKGISLKFEKYSGSLICWVDHDKFEKIMNNLLSNAVKFTFPGGEVKVAVKELYPDDKRTAIIKITDNGVGIPADKVDKIFDRFFQVDDSAQRSYGGSGIGLALVKEFVDLHKWKIKVTSELNRGTEFTIEIPMADDYLNEDEKVKDNTINNSPGQNLLSRDANSAQTVIKSSNKETKKKPLILIVDDSEDVRNYLESLLKDEFEVSKAANGEAGIKCTAEIIPDLIISDIMMPSMDGMEFCRRIKSDWRTSDIPIILLTAKVSFETKIESMEIGADDYIVKPFDSKELFARIRNLLEQRNRLKEKYNGDIEKVIRKNITSAENDNFITRAVELIEENLDNVNFNTEQLAKELFLSRTQLHRKISEISGQPPGEFIRTYKLKRAAEFLAEKKLSVTQIAYEIGFSSPSQFSRAFAKQYNCSPSDFLKNFS